MTGILLASLLALASVLSVQSYADVILVKGGTVVNHDRSFVADLLIRNGLIEAVGENLQIPGEYKEIDASGKYVMPGGIDPHTHMEMPFMGTNACDDFFSGQAAALAGGTTMHIDFVLPIDHDLVKGYDSYVERAKKSCMDYSFHMAVTQWNNKTGADMAYLVSQGVTSFKFFMAYKNALQVSDEELLAGFERCKELGALPMVHCENGDGVVAGQRRVFGAGITGPEGHGLSRPAVLEGEATGRAIRLARFTNVPLYVVHVMSIDAMEEVARARAAGQRVVGEPVASGLSLNESCMWQPDFKAAAACVMSPPLRPPQHNGALRKALAGGVLQLVATDHCVFNSTQKARGRHDFRLIPNGVNGIEERMHVVWQEMVVSGLITPSDFVRVTSTTAAQVFGLYPQKGTIAAGSDADVVVLDPHLEHTISAATHHSRIDTNIYEGKHVRGKVVVTISRGRVVWEHGQLQVQPGTGRFLARTPYGSLYHGLDAVAQAENVFPYGPTPVKRDGSSPRVEL